MPLPARPESAITADETPARRRRLWALAYRMTGCAADADDIVQETIARSLEHAAGGVASAAEPWLVRVATNLAIDALRARRRRAYAGAWLPGPVEHTDESWLESIAGPDVDPESRYDLGESVTIAFLVALEALGPRQRAVLLLRDVLGHSPAEAAAVLGTTEGNVRVLHLRARRTMAAYDRARCVPSAALRARHRVALERFLGCLAAGDVGGLEQLLAESVRTATDAAGEYGALRAPLDGRAAVARFYVRAARNRVAGGPSVRIALVNGLPAAIVELAQPVRRQAPRLVLALQLDGRGLVAAVHTILAPGKLVAIAGGAAARPAP